MNLGGCHQGKFETHLLIGPISFGLGLWISIIYGSIIMGGLRKPGAAMRELQDPRVAEREHLRFALTEAAKHLDEFETQLKRSMVLLGCRTRAIRRFSLIPPTLKTTVSKRLRTFTMAFAAVALFICGYAASIFGVLESWPVKVFGFDTKQQHHLDVLANDLAAVREEIGLHIRRENAAQAAALELSELRMPIRTN